MAAFSYSLLQSEYDNFNYPIADVEVNGTSIVGDKNRIRMANLTVDLTCGFEASQASFSLYNAYDATGTQFVFGRVKKYCTIGSLVKVYAGYGTTVREIFRGIICRTDFFIEEDDIPYVQVTAMDVKAIMMANRYHKQLLASTYSGAVKEIFGQMVYQNLLGLDNLITDLNVFPTPDAPPVDIPDTGAALNPVDTPDSIEMVGESDYEFVVRAAKKFNYEFFSSGGQVNFRPAKSVSSTLITLNNEVRFKSLNVSYDITGIVNKVEVRGVDVGKGKAVSFSKRNMNKLSKGMMAKMLVAGSEFVYTDPTVSSILDAKNRVEYLMDNMSYRFGYLEFEIYGIPEIVPGRFIALDDFGDAVSNDFYVTNVQHRFNRDGEFLTKIIGRAQGMRNLLGL